MYDEKIEKLQRSIQVKENDKIVALSKNDTKKFNLLEKQIKKIEKEIEARYKVVNEAEVKERGDRKKEEQQEEESFRLKAENEIRNMDLSHEIEDVFMGMSKDYKKVPYSDLLESVRSVLKYKKSFSMSKYPWALNISIGNDGVVNLGYVSSDRYSYWFTIEVRDMSTLDSFTKSTTVKHTRCEPEHEPWSSFTTDDYYMSGELIINHLFSALGSGFHGKHDN